MDSCRVNRSYQGTVKLRQPLEDGKGGGKMTERSSDPDQSATPGATPEDIATLYSRANVQGAYRDFSASRREARGQFRDQRAHEEAERQEAIAHSQDVDRAPKTLAGATSWAAAGVIRDESRPVPPGPLVPWPAAQQHDMARQVATHSRPGSTALPYLRGDLASRWYGLQSVITPSDGASGRPAAIQLGERSPALAVFSLAGGVGKTCLVATLGRALSALGERVLLADTAACGLLAFYFGSREFKPGVVRIFSPPGSPSGAESDASIHVLSLQAELYPRDGGAPDPLLGELVRDGRGAHRILVDVATANREVTMRLLMLRPVVLVPILPDMSSVASLGSLKAFLAGPENLDAGRIEPWYLLNQFDASMPLHVDLREMLRRQLGDRLLPFVLRRSSVVSEALAEGMTVIDYAPGSAAAEDYWHLADWLRTMGAPATITRGGARWSER